MNKEELIKKVAKNGDFYASHVRRYLDAICETIIDTLADGETVHLSGFGTFKTTEMKGKECLLNGEKCVIKPYRRTYFKLSPKAKEKFVLRDEVAKEIIIE